MWRQERQAATQAIDGFGADRILGASHRENYRQDLGSQVTSADIFDHHKKKKERKYDVLETPFWCSTSRKTTACAAAVEGGRCLRGRAQWTVRDYIMLPASLAVHSVPASSGFASPQAA